MHETHSRERVDDTFVVFRQRFSIMDVQLRLHPLHGTVYWARNDARIDVTIEEEKVVIDDSSDESDGLSTVIVNNLKAKIQRYRFICQEACQFCKHFIFHVVLDFMTFVNCTILRFFCFV